MIERDVSDSHLDALEAHYGLMLAQAQGGLAQVASFRQHLKQLKEQAAAPLVAVEIPEKCAQHDAAKCMVQDGEAANCGLSEMCRACGDVRPVM